MTEHIRQTKQHRESHSAYPLLLILAVCAQITPSSGKLAHDKHTEIVIEYQCTAYFGGPYHLVMGIPNVNRSALHLPMLAEFIVPSVKIPERIDFGRCSIRYSDSLCS